MKTSGLTHCVSQRSAKANSALYIKCFSQHLSSEHASIFHTLKPCFLSSELEVDKGGSLCSQPGKIWAWRTPVVTHHSTLQRQSTSALFKQYECPHKPRKKKKQQKWQKEATEKTILKQLGNCLLIIRNPWRISSQICPQTNSCAKKLQQAQVRPAICIHFFFLCFGIL